MFLQGGGKSGALSNRIAKLQNDFPESGIFLLFAQAIQSLWNGDCRPQQRSHLTRERSDFLSLDSLPITDVRPHGLRHRRSGGGSFVSGSTDFEVRRKQAALSQEMERRLSVLSLDHTLDGGAAQLDCLVSKRVHSNKSPEDTRMISSRLVIPSAAFCKASWCIVSMVFWATVFSSAFDFFWRMSSRSSGLIGSSSKMPIRPRYPVLRHSSQPFPR